MASEKEFFRLKGAEGVEGVVGTLFFLVVTPHQQPVLPYGRPTDRPRPGDQRRLGRPLPLYDVRKEKN